MASITAPARRSPASPASSPNCERLRSSRPHWNAGTEFSAKPSKNFCAGENSSRHDNSSPPEPPVTVENRSDGSIQTDQLKDLGSMTEPFGAVLNRNWRSEEHTSELQSHLNLVCRLLLEKKKKH